MSTNAVASNRPDGRDDRSRRRWVPFLKGLAPRSGLEITAVVLMFLFLFAAIFGPWLTPHDPNVPGGGPTLAGPSFGSWFGTDQLGRDTLSRVIIAARPAVLAAVESVAIAAVIGGLVGLIAGVAGRFIDGVLLRFMDVLFAFPEFLLAVVVISALGPGLIHATLAIGIVYIPRFARIVRGATLEIRALPYVDAARLAGRSQWWIVRRHIMPNITSPFIVLAALSMSTAQLAYAALSFLGFGEQPPNPDYGQMLASGSENMIEQPWVVLFPALALVLLVVGFNLFGDVLRDRLDPKST